MKSIKGLTVCVGLITTLNMACGSTKQNARDNEESQNSSQALTTESVPTPMMTEGQTAPLAQENDPSSKALTGDKQEKDLTQQGPEANLSQVDGVQTGSEACPQGQQAYQSPVQSSLDALPTQQKGTLPVVSQGEQQVFSDKSSELRAQEGGSNTSCSVPSDASAMNLSCTIPCSSNSSNVQ